MSPKRILIRGYSRTKDKLTPQDRRIAIDKEAYAIFIKAYWTWTCELGLAELNVWTWNSSLSLAELAQIRGLFSLSSFIPIMKAKVETSTSSTSLALVGLVCCAMRN